MNLACLWIKWDHVTVCVFRLKAGLKLQEEADKREVEQGIHLLQDPAGKASRLLLGYFMHSSHAMFTLYHLAITQKAREAQLQRQQDKHKAMEMETNEWYLLTHTALHWALHLVLIYVRQKAEVHSRTYRISSYSRR